MDTKRHAADVLEDIDVQLGQAGLGQVLSGTAMPNAGLSLQLPCSAAVTSSSHHAVHLLLSRLGRHAPVTHDHVRSM